MPVLVLAAGVIGLVEMAYTLVNAAETGTAKLRLPGLTLDARTAAAWVGSAAVVLAGGLLLRLAWRGVARGWHEVHQALREVELP